MTLGFFSDIFVPEFGLQIPSFFRNENSEWFWQYDDAEMVLELDEPIRLRVTRCEVMMHASPGFAARCTLAKATLILAILQYTCTQSICQSHSSSQMGPFSYMSFLGYISLGKAASLGASFAVFNILLEKRGMGLSQWKHGI